MDAKTARERRQARIRAGAADRLDKITGGNARATKLTEPAPPAPTAPADHDDPPDVLPDPSAGLAALLASPGAAPVHGDGAASAIEQLTSLMGGSAVDPDAPDFDLSTLLGPPPEPQNAPTASPRWFGAKWGILHTLCMVLLGLYSAFNPYKIWVLFLTTEIAITGLRYVVDPRPPPSMLMSLLQYLPAHIGTRLRLPLRAVLALKDSYQDLTTLLFVFCLFNHQYIR